ncbi:MAG: Flp pilus assembly complex ATPase component TadA [Bdellovibrionales bacterium]|nr:Flp pilus assembly complex ATPase component TadA [Bdellovibrionales bacterium]
MAIVVQIQLIRPGEPAETVVTETFSSAEVTLGRVAGNDVVLAQPDVSSRHAKLTAEEGVLRIVDLNSSNGTFLEDTRVSPGEPTLIPDGARVLIGSFLVTANVVEEASSAGVAEEEEPHSSANGVSGTARESIAVESIAPSATASEEASVPEEAPAEQVAPVQEVKSTEEVAVEKQAAKGAVVDDSMLATLLAEPTWAEIVVRRHDQVLLDRGKGFEQVPAQFSSPEALLTALRGVLPEGESLLSEQHPVAEASLEGGIMVRAACPPASGNGACAVFSRFVGNRIRMSALVANGFLSDEAARILLDALARGVPLVITGARGTGKTTLLGALVAEFSEGNAVVLVQESPELIVGGQAQSLLLPEEGNHPEQVPSLLRLADTLRPDLLGISDCSSLEIFDALEVLQSQTPSILCIEAGSSEELVERLLDETDGFLPGGIERLVVETRRFRDGTRAVTEISVLYPGEDCVERAELFYFTASGVPSAKTGTLQSSESLAEWFPAEQ